MWVCFLHSIKHSFPHCKFDQLSFVSFNHWVIASHKDDFFQCVSSSFAFSHLKISYNRRNTVSSIFLNTSTIPLSFAVCVWLTSMLLVCVCILLSAACSSLFWGCFCLRVTYSLNRIISIRCVCFFACVCVRGLLNLYKFSGWTTMLLKNLE